jgi:hypothetical protein
MWELLVLLAVAFVLMAAGAIFFNREAQLREKRRQSAVFFADETEAPQAGTRSSEEFSQLAKNQDRSEHLRV